MATKFSKISDSFKNHPKWAGFFHAGNDWLQALHILREKRDEPSGIPLFYVDSYILFFSLELFVKALASYEDPEFDAKKGKTYHEVTKIISDYKDRIPVFARIFDDKKLLELIREYQKTVNTRFGETIVSVNGTDENLMIWAIGAMREDMCKKTGLR